MGEIIHLNEPEIKQQLGEMVRKTVEETLNAMLDAEADEITQAHKYERTESRADTRAGHYTRKLTTKAGKVSLRVPKLRKLPLEMAIIERYKRREESVEEALIEMYLARVSVRRVEDIFPREHWLRIRSNNSIERINREIRRRTNAVGCFPDGNSALMLVCARLRYVSASSWGVKKYLHMERLYTMERDRKATQEVCS